MEEDGGEGEGHPPSKLESSPLTLALPLPLCCAVVDNLWYGPQRQVWLGYQQLLYQLLRDGGQVSAGLGFPGGVHMPPDGPWVGLSSCLLCANSNAMQRLQDWRNTFYAGDFQPRERIPTHPE